ncbi:hypothetical protein BRC81_07080 [Halobacteriales archaeon QS_1_68_20]|nr:MAG: hypothetical protein BRC81_07080 [Halobacteriales archaeon QS_1_68_20]
MALSDIAAGLEVTTEQRERGVAAVYDTGRDLPTRLAAFEDDLPCDAASAATLVEAYTGGRSVGECARRAGLSPVAAAKTLHLLGVEGVCPLSPQGRRILRDWLAGDLSRTEARQLAGASETEFALATFVETHDPVSGAREAVDGDLRPGDDGDALADAMSDVDDLLGP